MKIKKIDNSITLFYLVFSLPILIQAQEWQHVININADSRVFELYPDSIEDKLFIGGQFDSVDHVYTSNIGYFDGNEFHSLAHNIDTCWNLGCQGVFSIGRFKNEIYASSIRSANDSIGMPFIDGIGRWNGSIWNGLGLGIDDDLPGIYVPNPGIAYDFYITPDTLYVAGYINYADGKLVNGVASWDGNAWHSYNIPVDAAGGNLNNSVAMYKNNLYVGGNFQIEADGKIQVDIIRYDGASWKGVGNGLIDGWTNLRDLEVFKDKLYVAGYFAKADGNPGNSIMSWDGENWDDLGGGICSDFGAIDDLFVYKDKLYVAGYFDCIGGIEAHNVASWDGKSWCSIGHSTFNRPCHAIAVWHDTVYVGGSFDTINDIPFTKIARFVGDHSTDNCAQPVAVHTAPSQQNILNISPNPAVGWVSVGCKGASIQSGTLRLFDSAGRECSSLLSGIRIEAGRMNFRTDQLPPGVYCLVVGSMDGYILSGRFVKSQG
jgi:hypothetical protein